MPGPSSYVKEHQTRELICYLTDPEVKARAEDLAHTLAEIDHVEAERKEAMSGFKERLEGLHKKKHELAQNVRERAEWRDVECQLVVHPELGYAEWLRPDTGEQLSQRPLDRSEKQGNLFVLPGGGQLAAVGDDDAPDAETD